MHLVSRRGTAEMGEARTGDEEMRAVGMIERRHDFARRQQRGIIQNLAFAHFFDRLLESEAHANGALRQFGHSVDIAHRYGFVAFDARHAAQLVRFELDEIHAPPFSYWPWPSSGSRLFDIAVEPGRAIAVLSPQHRKIALIHVDRAHSFVAAVDVADIRRVECGSRGDAMCDDGSARMIASVVARPVPGAAMMKDR